MDLDNEIGSLALAMADTLPWDIGMLSVVADLGEAYMLAPVGAFPAEMDLREHIDNLYAMASRHAQVPEGTVGLVLTVHHLAPVEGDLAAVRLIVVASELGSTFASQTQPGDVIVRPPDHPGADLLDALAAFARCSGINVPFGTPNQ